MVIPNIGSFMQSLAILHFSSKSLDFILEMLTEKTHTNSTEMYLHLDFPKWLIYKKKAPWVSGEW